jgi:hypothetical protein
MVSRGRTELITALIFLVGVVGMVVSFRIPDYHRWTWVSVWACSLIFMGVGVIRACRTHFEDRDEEDEEEGDVNPAKRISRIANAVTRGSLAILEEEHQAEEGYWDSYFRRYVVQCSCSEQFIEPTLEIAGRRMDSHHGAFVRFVTGLRQVHELGTGPLPETGLEGPARALGDIGKHMDADWILLSKEQRKEASLLSTEIAWRLTAARTVQSFEEEPTPTPVTAPEPVFTEAEPTVVVAPTYLPNDAKVS